VLTRADIPPGGEGEVEVTFNTGRRQGKQSKSVTITTNDPETPKARVRITAFIEVDFGFESRMLNFGDVDLTERVTKTAFFRIKEPNQMQISELKSSSPYIEVTKVSQEPDTSGGDRVELAVTLLPELDPGSFRESITVRSTKNGVAPAKLNVYGKVRGDINVMPERLRFDVKPIKGEQTSPHQVIQIINMSPDNELEILSAEDPDGRLKLEIKTLQSGQRYQVVADIDQEALGTGTYFRGEVIIETNNSKQETIKVDYNIYNR